MSTPAAPDFGGYVLEGSFVGPHDPSVGPVLDALPDGRLLLADGESVYLESARGARTFARLRPTGAAGGFTSFLRVAPDGLRAAMGDGVSITVFEVANPTSQVVHPVAGFDAEWLDDRQLVLSRERDVAVLQASSGAIVPVITRCGGGAAGVAIDAEGTLLTGNGFDTSAAAPSRTGTIKAFVASQWTAPLAGGPVVDFEQAGRAVAELLSAAALGFDDAGHLYVGGGELFADVGGPRRPDRNYAALVNGAALRDAMQGGPPIVPGSPRTKLHVFDPDEGSTSFYSVAVNSVTGELYLAAFGGATVHVLRRIEPRDRILLMTTSLHFGDNPGVFHGAAYVGSRVSWPLRVTWVDERPEVKQLRFVFQTRELRTWGASRGHEVLVGDTPIGRLASTSDSGSEGGETHVVGISKARLSSLVDGDGSFTLSIRLEAGAEGVADDFVLTRVETVGFAVKAGRRG